MQVPTTTLEFLDALKAKKGWTSDYQLWKALGWKQTTVSNYRNGRAAIAGVHAMRIAEELELPHAYVLACGEAERERNGDIARVWKALAAHLRSAAASILLALLLGVGLLGDAKTATAAEAFSLSTVPASHAGYILW